VPEAHGWDAQAFDLPGLDPQPRGDFGLGEEGVRLGAPWNGQGMGFEAKASRHGEKRSPAHSGAALSDSHLLHLHP
jgi:hypothetical protein